MIHDRTDYTRARVNMFVRDWPFHRRTAFLMEEEARVSVELGHSRLDELGSEQSLPEEASSSLSWGYDCATLSKMDKRGRPTRLNPGITLQPVARSLIQPFRSPVAKVKAMNSTRVSMFIGQHVIRPKCGDDSQPREQDVVDLPSGLRGWKRVSHKYCATRGESSEVCHLYSYGNCSNMVDTLIDVPEAIEMATELMDRRINTFAERQAENKRKLKGTLLENNKTNTTKQKAGTSG
ncbi:hypothetical protein Tco_0448879 [Tanacetum coccineum]